MFLTLVTPSFEGADSILTLSKRGASFLRMYASNTRPPPISTDLNTHISASWGAPDIPSAVLWFKNDLQSCGGLLKLLLGSEDEQTDGEGLQRGRGPPPACRRRLH